MHMRRALLVMAVLLVLGSAVLAADAPATATATVCAAVKDRACQGAGETFAANVGQLYCLSEVKGGTDKIVHAWFFGDKEVAAIDLAVKGDRWRTWSGKRVVPTMKGAWRVEVRDAGGAVLATAKFTVE
jgi:hypothetical protein